MAITRSQIARQLLAEGGAPRIPFRNGGGRTDADTMSGSGYGAGSSSSNDGFGGGDDVARPTYSQQLTDIQNAESTGETFPGLSKVTPRNVFGVSADNPMLQRSLFERAMIQMIPGFGGAINLGEMNAFNLPQFRYSNTGGIDDRFNTTDDDNNQIVKPMMPMVPKLPTDIEPEESDYEEFVQRFSLPERFRLAEGGEPRQAYGLGKLVKKVTGAVKKVAKSDIGKAALAGAAIYGLGGGGNPFTAAGRSGFSFGNLPLVGSLFTAPGNPAQQLAMGSPFSRFLGTTAGKATLGIGAATVASGLLTPKQEEEVDSLSKRISDNTGIDVEAIRKEVQKATAEGQDSLDALKAKYPFLITESAAKADGGRIGFENGGTYEDFEKFMMKRQESMSERQKEELRKQFENYMRSQDPTVEAAEGGSIVPEEDEMLNMGGNEMDLRGGGFVPLGEYEKKDDVPARLSKNEFVFTADAVRAAGGGSVDRGADLMYKTMKQLENKVV
jgi:hypothetical protein